jgi:hypothetical protein
LVLAEVWRYTHQDFGEQAPIGAVRTLRPCVLLTGEHADPLAVYPAMVDSGSPITCASETFLREIARVDMSAPTRVVPRLRIGGHDGPVNMFEVTLRLLPSTTTTVTRASRGRRPSPRVMRRSASPTLAPPVSRRSRTAG